MELTAHDQGVHEVNAQQYRSYSAAAKERDFTLVDVRQPEEYAAEHIPGAVLLPLMELETRASELRSLAQGKRVVFVCRSGGRSGRAADFAARVLRLPNVFNLTGGMLGWNGTVLNAMPNLRPFAGTGTLEEALTTALALEKGSDAFYAELARQLEGTPASRAVQALLRMEGNHARTVYDALVASSSKPVAPYEQLMANLPADVLESGESLPQAVARIKSLQGAGAASLLELALELELRAQDLYRNLAAKAEREDRRKAFLALADEEKRHAQAITKALAQLA